MTSLEDIMAECQREAQKDEETVPDLAENMAKLAFGTYSDKVQKPEIARFKPRVNYTTQLPSHKSARIVEQDARRPASYGNNNMNEEGTYYHGFPESDILLLDVYGLIPQPGYGSNVAFSWSDASGYRETTVHGKYGASRNMVAKNVTAVISKAANLQGELFTDSESSVIPLGEGGQFCRPVGLTIEGVKSDPNLAVIQPDTWLRTDDYVHSSQILGWIVGDENQAGRINEMMDLELLAPRRIWLPDGKLYRSAFGIPAAEPRVNEIMIAALTGRIDLPGLIEAHYLGGKPAEPKAVSYTG